MVSANGEGAARSENEHVVFLSFRQTRTQRWLSTLHLYQIFNRSGVDHWIGSLEDGSAYAIDLHDDEVRPQIGALSGEVLEILANVLARIAADPWDSEPMEWRNRKAPLRTLNLGDVGFVVFLVLDSPGLRRVDLLRVILVDEAP